MNRLNSKVIVVTGGSGLLGREILKFIKSEGSIAFNADINISTDIEKGMINCDITNEDSIKRVIDIVINLFGRIDGWVNNAYPRSSDWNNKFEDISVFSWKQNVDFQLNSLFLCSQLVLTKMKINGKGSVVNIASIYGTVGPDFNVYKGTELTMPAAYSAIKGGVVNLTRYLASYYGANGIRINCVSPGGIFNNQDPLFVKQYSEKVPMKRMGQAEEIAPAVVFLLSEEASYITGHNLLVDGGWTSI
ncbi:MAG: SDR family oxidoreductase [bacterium]